MLAPGFLRLGFHRLGRLQQFPQNPHPVATGRYIRIHLLAAGNHGAQQDDQLALARLEPALFKQLSQQGNLTEEGHCRVVVFAGVLDQSANHHNLATFGADHTVGLANRA